MLFRSVWQCLVRRVGFECLGMQSQMCVGTFSRHSTALFDPFHCSANSSLELFCPACFKKPFRLLGFVWDWILCIKRCSARFEGQWQAGSPQWRGAGIAPHKQRIKPVPRGSLSAARLLANQRLSPQSCFILPCRRTKDNRGLHRAIK